MKNSLEKRRPGGLLDYFGLAVTTFGVGYFPIAPGTWGSMVGVLIFVGVDHLVIGLRSKMELSFLSGPSEAQTFAVVSVGLIAFTLISFWASGRAISILGDTDPSEAVIDEVLGQLITFTFVPFGIGWPFILVGFFLFRLFDIWKPYPIDYLQTLPGGIGICADDILAGVYAGVCLSVVYAVSLST